MLHSLVDIRDQSRIPGVFGFEMFRALITCLCLLPVLYTAGCSSSAGPFTIALGTTTSEVNSIIFIAQELGYFEDNGINLVHTVYPSGSDALGGMFEGEVDLATGSEFAFTHRVLAGDGIRTVGSICRSSIEYLVCRTDRGIDDVFDLAGKTIGLPMGSRPEFALSRYLFFRGLDPSEVTFVDVKVDQSVEAIASGTIDAVAVWEPYTSRIVEQMGNRVVSWSVQEDQPSYTLLMTTREYITTHQEHVSGFLQALLQAEAYIIENPEEASEMVRQRLSYSQQYMAGIWPDYRFSISLNQALVAAMEDQARWIIEHGLSSEKATPNFLENICYTCLEKVKPEAVTIIR